MVWLSVINACPENCRCLIFRHSATVSCRSRNLTEIPSDIPKRALLLDLQSNDIRSIKTGAFQQLSHLKRLLLANTTFSKVPVGAFVGLHSLKFLSLLDNKISLLEKDAFVSLENVEHLGLGNNKIKRIHPLAFRGMKRLKYLSLLNNSITQLESGIFDHLPALQKLDLGENFLTFIDKNTFSKNSRLSVLEMRNNAIHTLHPDALSGLNIATQLDLSFNKIRNLSSGSFNHLSKLKVLKLDDNKITHLTTSTFEGLKHLDLLHLGSNRLQNIEDNTFLPLGMLRKMFLEKNNLTTITSCTFNGLEALRILDVSFNQLTSIASDAFMSTLGIYDLHLQYNQLTTIEELTFSRLRMLRTLGLSNNRITEIPPLNFHHKLRELNLLGSRIDCNCRQISLAMSLNADNVIASCILDQSKNRKAPSIVYSSDTDWSNWRALSAYSTDSVKRACNAGVKVRSRKCVSCAESYRPWCIAQIPQPRERCISFHAIKRSAIFPNDFLNTSQEATTQDIPKPFQILNGVSSVYVHYLCHLSGCSSTVIENTRANTTKSLTMDFKRQKCQPVDNSYPGRSKGLSPLVTAVITFTPCVCVLVVAVLIFRAIRRNNVDGSNGNIPGVDIPGVDISGINMHHG